MSTQRSGAVRAVPTRPAPSRGPGLQVVPGTAIVRRGNGFVVVLATMLVIGLVGLLLLNLSMQKGAFELAGVQARTADLTVQQQALDQQLEQMQSTQKLALRATAQGMVPSTDPVFLDLSDGSVIGKQVPAIAGQTLPGLVRPESGSLSGADSRTDTPAGTTGQQDAVGQTEGPAMRRVD